MIANKIDLSRMIKIDPSIVNVFEHQYNSRHEIYTNSVIILHITSPQHEQVFGFYSVANHLSESFHGIEHFSNQVDWSK